jgi:hypothetical protein
MKILLFTSIVFIIIAINLIISCPTKEGFMKNKYKKKTLKEVEDSMVHNLPPHSKDDPEMREKIKKIVKKADKDNDGYINKDETKYLRDENDVNSKKSPENIFVLEKKDYNDDGNPSQKFLRTFQRQKIEFDGEFSLKSLTPEIPDNEEEAKKLQKERDAKRKEQKKAKKETQRESERQIKRRERDAKRFCISSIPKTLWQWITEPFREIYNWLVKKLGMKWIGKCIDAKVFIIEKIWDIKKLIIYGFRDVFIDIIMFPCRKLGLDKAYRPLWRSKVNVYNSITAPISELLTWKKLKILRALKFIC